MVFLQPGAQFDTLVALSDSADRAKAIAEDCPRFSIHYHTQLWQSQDAKNPANGYGTLVAGKVWHWYERWVDEVRKRCRDSGGKYS